LGEDAAVRRKQPAKLKPTNFFTAPPRTQIFEESDNADGTNDMTFKKRAAAAAPANLGEISGSEYCCAPTLPPHPPTHPQHRLPVARIDGLGLPDKDGVCSEAAHTQLEHCSTHTIRPCCCQIASGCSAYGCH
jgi:hypothetical protein